MMQEKITDSLIQVNQSLLKAVDSLKLQNQIEKLNYKIDTQNSIVADVNSFYDSAWLKLIFVITILGIILPVLIQYFQRKNINQLTNQLKESFETKIANIKDETNSKIDTVISQYEEKINKIEKKHLKSLLELDANTYFLQGRTNVLEHKWIEAASSFSRAAFLLQKCKRTDRIIPTLNNVILALKNINENEISEIDSRLIVAKDKKNLDEILVYIEKKSNNDSIIHQKISEIRELIKNNCA